MQDWLEQIKMWWPAYKWRWISGATALVLLSAAATVWFIPSLHAEGSRWYHQGLQAVGMEEEWKVVSPTETVDPLAAVKEQIGQLEQELTARKDAQQVLQQSFEAMQEQLKSAVAEVSATNDVLTKQQEEWTAALRRLGTVVTKSPTPTPGSSNKSASNSPSSSSASTSGIVHINSATLFELDSLPGIGPSYAQKIIDYRTEKGGFKTLEEIMEVPGIGQATFDKMKDQIAL